MSDETQALKLEIGRADGPVLLVWVKATPRLTTMAPLTRVLRAAGHAAFLVISDAVQMPEDGALLDGLPSFRVPRSELKTLRGVALFISDEKGCAEAPPGAVRFGMHHSLPDNEGDFDYAVMLHRNVMAAVDTDYFALPVTQRPEWWTYDHYAPAVQGAAPAVLVEGRRPDLTLVPMGYPKVDLLMERAAEYPRPQTLLYAPTQSTQPFGSVKRKGAEIIARLLENFPQRTVVFRPYPGAEIDRVAPIAEQFADDPRFVFDTSPTGEAEMARAAVVITDRSSAALSFALGLARPVVFFRPGSGPPAVRRADPYGLVAGNLAALVRAVRRCVQRRRMFRDRIVAGRADVLNNPGYAAEYLADAIPDILAGRHRDDWITIPRQPYEGRTPQDHAAFLARMSPRIGTTGHNAKALPIYKAALKRQR